MAKTRVVVVDDSALVRSLLSEIINRQVDMQCVGAASDPFVAREMIRNTNPDVITLDVEMPRMDGITFLRKLMSQRPIPVVMCSSLTESGSETLMQALEAGAVAVVARPPGIGHPDHHQTALALVQTVRAMAEVRVVRRWPRATAPASAPTSRCPRSPH